jgi:hypothetical protein
MMIHHTDNNKRFNIYESKPSPGNHHRYLHEITSPTPKSPMASLLDLKSKDRKAEKMKVISIDRLDELPQTFIHKLNLLSPNQQQSNHANSPSTSKQLFRKNYSNPTDQLRRTVGNNLSYFMIDFDRSITPRDLPSAIIACELIQEHFIKNLIIIHGFSVAIFLGHRLKLGVNNMEDYSKVVLSDEWPTTIDVKKITIVKPKFVPECFTLVVRYIPKLLSIQNVFDEIKRSINSS